MCKTLRVVTLSSLFIAGLWGCSTPSSQQADDVNFPLTTITSVVEDILSMGIQGTSENHREFYSKPFVVAQSEEATDLKLRERGKAKVVVLGSERPYKIEVEVRIERSKPSKNKKGEVLYEFNRYDDRLATQLVTKIMDKLNRTRNQNLIDDFKPF